MVADAENPSDVENLQAAALNGGAKLTWSAATDNVGVTGYQVHYGLTPVTEKGQTYDTVVDAKKVTEYTLSGLENGKKYYFSVIAYDAVENESAHWADEASATPVPTAASAEDKIAPQVADTKAVYKEQVRVVFSEEIVLPTEDPQDAFSIENNEDLTALTVSAAEMDEEDKTNKTVLLTTATQTENVEYTLTAGISIKDKAGNQIISGTSDTAVFVGSAAEAPAEDTQGPKVVKAEAVDSTHFTVTFDEAIVLGIDPAENFKIQASDDTTDKLTVLAVTLGADSGGTENAFAVVKTSEQSDKNYVVTVVGVTDENGNAIDTTSNSSTFTGSGQAAGTEEPVEDIIAPEDVAGFLAKAVFEANKYVVTLTWDLPEDSEWDSVIQQLYTSTDKGKKYEETAELEVDVNEYEVADLEPGEYWFKLTQKDAAGNESEGVITKIVLAETGPGLLGLALVSLGLGRVVTRKKK